MFFPLSRSRVLDWLAALPGCEGARNAAFPDGIGMFSVARSTALRGDPACFQAIVNRGRARQRSI